jgi:hypothetical protein
MTSASGVDSANSTLNACSSLPKAAASTAVARRISVFVALGITLRRLRRAAR